MPFDANLVLRDGSVDLDAAEAVAVSLTANADGAKVIDIGGTTRPRGESEGVMNLVCTLVLPTAPTTAYSDTLYVQICESDNLTFGYNTIAIFGYYYSFTRMLPITVTTAFVAGDIDDLATGATTGDTGNIRWMHPDTFTVGKQTHVIISMEGADDLFDDIDEAVTIPGTGRFTMRGAGFVETKPRRSGPNTHFRTISPTKRYIQATLTVAGASVWGKASLFLSPYPFRTL